MTRVREEALTKLKSSGESALEPYRRIREMATMLLPLQEAAEGAAPHLLHHLVSIADDLRGKIKDTFAADLVALLSSIKWPNPVDTVSQDKWSEWGGSITKLLALQKPELETFELDENTNNLAVLLPFEVMTKPIELRFRYHFDGDRPTNRLDRPEYFFSHVNDLIIKNDDFLAVNIQPLLSSFFQGSVLASKLIYIDATSAFITALLPMLRSKIFSMLPKVSNQPPLLSHLIYETMNFDTLLREEWNYDGGHGAQGWKGLAWEVLAEKGWFDRWLQIEKECQ